VVLAAVDDHGVGGLLLLFVVVVVLGEQETRAGVGEGGERRDALDQLRLVVKLAPETSKELHGQVMIGHRIADVSKVVGDGLKAVGVCGDPHVAARRASKDLAEIHIAGGSISKEKIMQARPCGGGAAVGADDESMEIVGEGLHKPQGDVDVIRHPVGRRSDRGGALRTWSR
jgi:hypothetical protein